MKITISTKLIVMTVSFLAATTVTIALTNSREIEKRISGREKDFNQEKAHSKAIEVRGLLNAAVERTVTLGQQLALSGNSSSINFEKDRHLVALTVYHVVNNQIQPLAFKMKESFLKDNNLQANFFTNLRNQIPFPLASLLLKKVELRNSTLPKSPPLLTIGIPLTRDENGKVSHLALADFKLEILQAPFSERSTRVIYLTDRKGMALAHQKEEIAIARLNLDQNPLVSIAMTSEAQNLQKEFDDPDSDKKIIGAFEKLNDFGVVVYTEVDRSIVQEAVDSVISSNIETAGIAVSIAIFLIFLFSMTLTSPIEKLAGLIQLVSRGNFDVKARLQIRSDDEVGDLAIAFDRMTEGLKERDKVKSLFRKFHGSSVAEDLIKNDIGVGGRNKEVTVFFSDIRGFTKFSETRTPEQVVAMLNEYFEVMVGIINRHNGVVDKFIGDAIMAVWGAPQTGKQDTLDALKACLEMRKALAKFNEKRLARGEDPILIGMGLHTGHVISGTIGSTERMEYTVIGDTVNLTSRIESSTKAFGTDLLVSADVSQKLSEKFKFESAGTVEVKGKSEPLELFKVRGHLSKDGQFTEVRTEYSDYEASEAEKVKMVS